MIQVPFSYLSTKELYTLALRVKELCSSIDAEATGLTLFFNHFTEQFSNYEQAMHKISVTAEEVSMADTKRDELLIGLKANLRSYKYHPEQAKRDAANSILNTISQNGQSIYDQSYKVETAILERIFADIDANYLDALSLLGLTEWYNQLKEAQIGFEEKLHNYTSIKANENAISSASELRPALQQSLRKLFAFIPMQAEITENESLIQLAEQLAVEAERF